MIIQPGAALMAFFMLGAPVFAALGLLWTLHRGMRGLSERAARVEGLLEGLRDSLARQR